MNIDNNKVYAEFRKGTVIMYIPHDFVSEHTTREEWLKYHQWDLNRLIKAAGMSSRRSNSCSN